MMSIKTKSFTNAFYESKKAHSPKISGCVPFLSGIQNALTFLKFSCPEVFPAQDRRLLVDQRAAHTVQLVFTFANHTNGLAVIQVQQAHDAFGIGDGAEVIMHANIGHAGGGSVRKSLQVLNILDFNRLDHRSLPSVSCCPEGCHLWQFSLLPHPSLCIITHKQPISMCNLHKFKIF